MKRRELLNTKASLKIARPAQRETGAIQAAMETGDGLL